MPLKRSMGDLPSGLNQVLFVISAQTNKVMHSLLSDAGFVSTSSSF